VSRSTWRRAGQRARCRHLKLNGTLAYLPQDILAYLPQDILAYLPQDILGSKSVGVLLQHLKHTGQQLALAPPGDLCHRTSNFHVETRHLARM
jgi:hypothetical protein